MQASKIAAVCFAVLVLAGFRGSLTTNIAAPHLAAIATRTYLSSQIDATNLQFNSQSCHFARTSGSSFQIVVPNWYVVQGGAETNSGGTLTLFAAANVNGGTLTRITWSAATSIAIADGATAVSDALSLAYTSGQLICVRFFGTAAAGRIYTINNANSSLGDALNIAASGLSDLTLGGTITSNSNNNMSAPAAIIGTTIAPIAAIIGDSICQGQNDTKDSSGDVGSVARSIGPTLAYINACIGSDSAALFIASHAKRVSLINSYATTVINEYGNNDLASGKTSAQIVTSQATIAALFPGKTLISTTITPRSTSSDLWQTTGNQTTVASNSIRATYNAAVRAGLASYSHFAEIANVIDTVQDSGIWNVTGTACINSGGSLHGSYTCDGVHPNIGMYLLIQGTTNPAWIQ